MDPHDMNDDQLLIATEKLVGQEREMLTQVLHHLREVNKRRLFSMLGFRSLFDYAVKKLCYSEDQAYRRISAMRLLEEIPELENKLNVGSLSLTNVGLVQSFFRQESKARAISADEKSSVIAKIENLSTRDAEKVLLQNSTNPIGARPDRTTALNSDISLVQFSADQQLLNKIGQLKGLMAHKLPQATMSELLHVLCDLGLKTWSPAAPQKRRGTNASLLRQVWRRDQGECQNCGSRHALQIDHVIPKAKGGSNEPENLRLLCRNCNQRAAVEHYGAEKMARFLGA